jgi:tetratricopeptide (TPR) repeat protein
MMTLADVLRRQRQWSEARKLLEETLELNRRLGPPAYPARISIMGELGRVLYRLGRYEEARSLYEEAIQLCRRVIGPKHPDNVLLIGELGRVLYSLGRHGEACNLYEEAIQLSRGVNGPKHPVTLQITNSLAWLLATTAHAQVGDLPRALALAKQVVQEMPNDEDYWSTLGAAYYASGDWPNAITALEKSEELAPGKLVAENGLFLAMAHWQLSRPAAGDPEPTLKRPPSTALEQARNRDAARQAYNKAAQWLERNPEADPELRRFRAEAAKLLGLGDAQAPVQNHSK